MSEDTQNTPAEGSKQETQDVISKQEFNVHTQKLREKYEGELNNYKTQLEELNKFKSEHEKQLEQQQQQDMEAKQQYDELKKQWSEKENQYKTMLNDKDSALNQTKIDYALANEVNTNNLYPLAKDTLKNMVKLTDSGELVMSGKDANGMVVDLPLSEGIKQFASDNPYLVKANNQGGAGTASVETAGNNQGRGTLSAADELQQAMKSGDRTRINEAKKAIQNKWTQAGISPTNF